MSIFPKEMMKQEMTLEGIASKLSYFQKQLHLLHWQTTSLAEHKALKFYEDILDFEDQIIEKLMGYMGKRPKAYKLDPLKDYSVGMSMQVLSDVCDFSYKLGEWADSQGYTDIKNICDTLSGEAAKTKYLLTLS